MLTTLTQLFQPARVRSLADNELDGWTKSNSRNETTKLKETIMMKTISILAIAGFILALAPTAQAGIIDILGGGGGITASSDYYQADNPGMHMDTGVIDGNGLDVTGILHSKITAAHTGQWFSASAVVADQWVQFDLGAVYDISSFEVWNEYEGWTQDRGTDAVSITYGTAITGALADGTIAPITNPGTLSITKFAQAPATNPYTGETFTEAFTAQYIQFNIGTNHGATATGLVGLAEVQFDGTLVPEPATMLLLGLGGLVLRRRRRA
jgi:hypothetical protein